MVLFWCSFLVIVQTFLQTQSVFISLFSLWYWGVFAWCCCWPITAACTLIQTQRPDAHLLLDFFQPTVNLCFSWPAIKIKCAVQLLTNYSAVNPLFKKWKCRKIAFWSLQRAEHNARDLKKTNIKGWNSQLWQWEKFLCPVSPLTLSLYFSCLQLYTVTLVRVSRVNHSNHSFSPYSTGLCTRCQSTTPWKKMEKSQSSLCYITFTNIYISNLMFWVKPDQMYKP